MTYRVGDKFEPRPSMMFSTEYKTYIGRQFIVRQVNYEAGYVYTEGDIYFDCKWIRPVECGGAEYFRRNK